MIAPNMLNPRTKVAALARLYEPERNSRSGSTGSDARRCTSRNATASTPEATSSPITRTDAQPHDGPEEALVPGPLAGRHDVGDDRERQRHQATGAQALHGPGEDQLGHVLRGAGQERADQERTDGEDQDRTAAVQVGHLAVQR